MSHTSLTERGQAAKRWAAEETADISRRINHRGSAPHDHHDA
jgi:hypothetical protein